MVRTLDWVKSLKDDIRGDREKGCTLRIRDVSGKMVMQIDGNDEKDRNIILTNIG